MISGMVPPFATVATTLLFVLACIVSDVRTLRIPNVLTGPAMLVGLVLNASFAGWAGLGASLAGFALALVILIGPFALGGVGGGDVKMMAAVGALVGPRLVLHSLVLGLILGGVFAIVHLARHARLREKLVAVRNMFVNAVLARSTAPLRLSTSSPNTVALPYSLPLGVGTLAVITISIVVTP
jgi:prepilin peptidase CpaA